MAVRAIIRLIKVSDVVINTLNLIFELFFSSNERLVAKVRSHS